MVGKRSVSVFLTGLDSFITTIPVENVSTPLYEIVLDSTTGESYLRISFRQMRRWRDLFLMRRIRKFFEKYAKRVASGEFTFYKGEVLIETSLTSGTYAGTTSNFWKYLVYDVRLIFVRELDLDGSLPTGCDHLLKVLTRISPAQYNALVEGKAAA